MRPPGPRDVATDADALVIGAGPAGAAAAIGLACAGWRVILVEQHAYPRQKVCGECLSAGCLLLLDELGVGVAVLDEAGPELQWVGWMSRAPTIVTALPSGSGAYRYGRALGRDRLDTLLLDRARALGVDIRQPARVRAWRQNPGGFDCEIDAGGSVHAPRTDPLRCAAVRVSIVIDAHGSWETGPDNRNAAPLERVARNGSDLFGFKASFQQATLPRGLLPLLSFPGGYGGMVLAERGRLTLACCVRRRTVAECRSRLPGAPVGLAIEHYLRAECPEIGGVLDRAQRTGRWLTVGPLRPGSRVGQDEGPFRVGNAAGETHPLIGEGIHMALQSARMLVGRLARHPAGAIAGDRSRAIHRGYRADWRAAFAHRSRLAAAYAHIAMRPAFSGPAAGLLRWRPRLLSDAARWAGKAGGSAVPAAPAAAR